MTKHVAFSYADMVVEIAFVGVVDWAKFAQPLRVGLSALPTTTEDHFEAFFNVFVTVLKLGMTEAAPVEKQ